MTNRPIPIRIRGIDYPSIAAAAQALDMTSSGISAALNRGTLEKCGLKVRRCPKTAVAVTDGNVTYPSISEAARAEGVVPSTIYRRLKYKQNGWRRI